MKDRDDQINKLMRFDNLQDAIDQLADFELPYVPYAYLQTKEITRGPRKGYLEEYFVGIECSDEITSIVDYLRRKTLMISDGAFLYIWNGVYYEEWDNNSFNKMIEVLYKKVYWKHRTKNAEEIKKQLINSEAVSPWDLNSSSDIIPFKNTWLQLQDNYTFKEIEPDPDIYLTYCIQHNYIPNSDCPIFEQKIAEIIPDQEERELALAFIAHSFLPRVINIKKFLLIWGPKDTGKSQLTSVLNQIFKGTVAGEKLEYFTDKSMSERSLTALRGKLLNLGSEIEEKRLPSDAILKDITGEDSIRIRMLYKESEKIRNITSHIFTANNLPPPPHNAGNPFFSRWIIVSCDNVVAPENRIANLSELFEHEIIGIIPFILKFSVYIPKLYIDRSKINKILWGKKGVSQYAFISASTLDFNTEIRTDDLYQIYLTWSRQKGYENTAAMNWFGRSLSEYGVFIRQKGNGNRYYVGIRPPNVNRFTAVRSIILDILRLSGTLDKITLLQQYNNRKRIHNLKPDVLDQVLDDLLNDGLIYTPTPSYYEILE